MSDLRVALGSTTYAVHRPFGDLPIGMQLQAVSAVAVTADGTVCVVQRSTPPVLVFSPEGMLLRTFGTGEVVDGHGATASPDGVLWVVDRDAHEIVAFDGDCVVVRRLGRRHRPRHEGAFNHPAAIAQAADGVLFIADGYGNSLIHVFDSEGHPLHRWGGPGAEQGQFSTPHGIVVDRSDRVHVADRENNRVQIFDREGIWLAEWAGEYHPMDLAEDPSGAVLVTDQTPRLTRYEHGVLAGRCRPVASAGHSVAVAADRTIYLAEPAPRDRITMLQPLPSEEPE
jgi:DNA-binding beta-propeller fold protein YncE